MSASALRVAHAVFSRRHQEFNQRQAAARGTHARTRDEVAKDDEGKDMGTIGQRIILAALALLEENPDGVRYSDVVRAVRVVVPSVNPETVRYYVWKLGDEQTDVVYKPSRGLFRLVKFAPGTPPLPSAQEPTRLVSIITPSAGEIRAAVDKFDAAWGGVDQVLYGVCRDHPDHTSRRSVMTKSILIERAYAAGLQRLVPPPEGGQAVDRIGDCLYEYGADVDTIIAGLDDVHEPLTSEGMRSVVCRHGELTRLLADRLTDGKSARSFVSKYLHFHRPVVPIYDDYCKRSLAHWVRRVAGAVPVRAPDGADREYYSFCVSFWRLYDACRREGMGFSVKDFDAFLWQVPE